MSFFTPRPQKRDCGTEAEDAPFLIAHFMPSPFAGKGIAGMATLPRIQIKYMLTNEVGRIRFHTAWAILSEQDLHVPLPPEAADLRIVRSKILNASKSIISKRQ